MTDNKQNIRAPSSTPARNGYFTTNRQVVMSGLLGVLLTFTGCEGIPVQTAAVWESYEDPQREWPTDQLGTLHIVDEMPVYDLAQLPPQRYTVLGFVHWQTVAAPGQPGPVDEHQVVAEARRRGGQAALLSRKPKSPLHPAVQQTDYLVVKFEKDPRRAALDLIEQFLSWSALNSGGYTNGEVHFTAEELATRRSELEAQRQLLLRQTKE